MHNSTTIAVATGHFRHWVKGPDSMHVGWYYNYYTPSKSIHLFYFISC